MLINPDYYEGMAAAEISRSYGGTTDELIGAVGRGQIYALLAIAAVLKSAQPQPAKGDFHESAG